MNLGNTKTKLNHTFYAIVFLKTRLYYLINQILYYILFSVLRHFRVASLRQFLNASIMSRIVIFLDKFILFREDQLAFILNF